MCKDFRPLLLARYFRLLHDFAEHHNPYFDIDEDVLYKGSAAAATYAIEFLKSDIDTSDRKFKGGYREVLLKSERAEKYDLHYVPAVLGGKRR